MKSPVLRLITLPLSRIEERWRAEHSLELVQYHIEKEQAELRHQAWREDSKRAIQKRQPLPTQPPENFSLPVQKRLIQTDSTFEKLHEILSDNPAGALVPPEGFRQFRETTQILMPAKSEPVGG